MCLLKLFYIAYAVPEAELYPWRLHFLTCDNVRGLFSRDLGITEPPMERSSVTPTWYVNRGSALSTHRWRGTYARHPLESSSFHPIVKPRLKCPLPYLDESVPFFLLNVRRLFIKEQNQNNSKSGTLLIR